MQRISPLVCVLLALPACKDKPAELGAPSPAPGPAKPTPASPPGIAESRARALVSSWLQAQNSGDFAAYSALYAERLTGIKRVGAQARSFARAAWLEDRQRMFQNPMTVDASNVQVFPGIGSVAITFQQSWESGTFKDVGPKQLIVVEQGDALKIAREEMLSSVVLSSRRSQQASAATGFRFVVDGLVVLGAAGEGWSQGPYRLIERDPFIAERDAQLTALPPEHAGVVGKPVELYSASGSCTATIGTLKIQVGVTPHFGVTQQWEDSFGDVGRKASDAEIARDVFGMAQGWLVAELEGECRGDYARLGGAATIQLRAAEPDEALKRGTRREQMKLASWKKEQERYRSENGATGDWDRHGTYNNKVAVFDDARANRRIVVIAALAGEGCGEWTGSHTAVFSVDSGGAYRLLGELEGYFEASAAFDLDGDGQIELLGEMSDLYSRHQSLLGFTDGKLAEIDRFGWSYQDCPC
jgi:ketosteroid isomerase-like protein